MAQRAEHLGPDAALSVARAYAKAVDDIDRALAASTTETSTSPWGKPRTGAQRQQILRNSLQASFALRKVALESSIQAPEAAALLNISPQAVRRRIARGTLIGLKHAGAWHLPVWQFAPNTPSGTLPGLQQLSTAYQGGPVGLTLWVAKPHVDLDGDTPLTRLRNGDSGSVAQLARSLTAAAH